MAEPAEDTIVHNLIEALQQLREDLDKVELWVAALGYFRTAVPEYQPGNQYVLPPSPQAAPPRRRFAAIRNEGINEIP